MAGLLQTVGTSQKGAIATGMELIKGKNKISYTVNKPYVFGLVHNEEEDSMSTKEYLKRANMQLKGGDGLEESAYSLTNIFHNGLVGAMAGAKPEITSIDQQSIKEAMWQTADNDKNGQVDNEEYFNLYSNLVTSKDVNKNLNKYGFTSVGFTGIAAIAEEFLPETKYTKEEYEAMNKLFELDKDIDVNKDGTLDRSEFDNAIINYILTEPDRLNPEE